MQVRAAQVESIPRSLRGVAPVNGTALVVMRGEQPFHVGAGEAHGSEGVDAPRDVWADGPCLGKLAAAGGGYLRLGAPGLALNLPERPPRIGVVSVWPRRTRFPALWLVAHAYPS